MENDVDKLIAFERERLRFMRKVVRVFFVVFAIMMAIAISAALLTSLL